MTRMSNCWVWLLTIFVANKHIYCSKAFISNSFGLEQPSKTKRSWLITRKTTQFNSQANPTTELIVYGEPGSRSPIVNWAAHELDLEVKDVPKNDTPHPFQQIPCLVDKTNGDNDIMVFESGAILIYLLENYSSPRQSLSAKEKAAITSWIMWANASLDFICFTYNEKGLISGTQLKKPNKRMEQLNAHFSQHDYLVPSAGFTLADVAVASYLLFVPQFFRTVNLNRWPHVVSYMKRCASREGYGKSFSLPIQKFVVQFLDQMPPKVEEEKLFGFF